MIKDRIIQLIEIKGFSKERFFTKIGMTSANFRGKSKERPLNSTAIENIFSEIPDVNLEWLITGKGEMIKPQGDLSDKDKPVVLKLLEMLEEKNKQVIKLSEENSTLKATVQHLQKENSNLNEDSHSGHVGCASVG